MAAPSWRAEKLFVAGLIGDALIVTSDSCIGMGEAWGDCRLSLPAACGVRCMIPASSRQKSPLILPSALRRACVSEEGKFLVVQSLPLAKGQSGFESDFSSYHRLDFLHEGLAGMPLQSLWSRNATARGVVGHRCTA